MMRGCLTWDGGGFRICGGDFVELVEKIREEKKYMIADRNPDLGFTAYDSIHGIKINTQSK